MNYIRNISLLAVLFGLSHLAYAETDHSMHDMPSATTQATNTHMDMMKQMDTQLQAMKDMHLKMSAAVTDAERQALMKDHMKVMRESLQMMSQHGKDDMHCMGKGKTASKKHHHLVEKH